jgi:hypothetical protein
VSEAIERYRTRVVVHLERREKELLNRLHQACEDGPWDRIVDLRGQLHQTRLLVAEVTEIRP